MLTVDTIIEMRKKNNETRWNVRFAFQFHIRLFHLINFSWLIVEIIKTNLLFHLPHALFSFSNDFYETFGLEYILPFLYRRFSNDYSLHKITYGKRKSTSLWICNDRPANTIFSKQVHIRMMIRALVLIMIIHHQ